ncbi:MAG: hypothetical protein K2G03_06030 [Bacilli bacterium]|nr:hypothetical protein [Bacilli bacterium]
MSKYIYLGTDGNRLLFYNPKKDEFYSAEEGYFGIEIDKDFETFDDLQARNQEAKEQAVLITDPYEIKALKIAYESINNYSKKERQLKKAIKALSKREKEEKIAT